MQIGTKQFPSLNAMIDHFRSHTLATQGGEKVTLTTVQVD